MRERDTYREKERERERESEREREIERGEVESERHCITARRPESSARPLDIYI